MTVTDRHAEAMATLKQFEQEQIERFRPKPAAAPEPKRRPPDVSIPALNMVPASPLARADVAAAHAMVATINRLQDEGSISTPLFGGDR